MILVNSLRVNNAKDSSPRATLLTVLHQFWSTDEHLHCCPMPFRLSSTIELGMRCGHLVTGDTKETTNFIVTVLAILAVSFEQIDDFMARGIKACCIQDSRLVAPATFVLIPFVEAHVVSAIEVEPLLWLHNQCCHVCILGARIIMFPRFARLCPVLLRWLHVRPRPKQDTLAIKRNAFQHVLTSNCAAVESHRFMEIMLVVSVAWDMEPTPTLFDFQGIVVKHTRTVVGRLRIKII